MTRAAYVGHEVLTFGDYTDLGTGRALRAEPGGVYDIAPASGRVVPEFPEPWFTRVADGSGSGEGEDDAPDEAGGEDDHGAF